MTAGASGYLVEDCMRPPDSTAAISLVSLGTTRRDLQPLGDSPGQVSVWVPAPICLWADVLRRIWIFRR